MKQKEKEKKTKNKKTIRIRNWKQMGQKMPLNFNKYIHICYFFLLYKWL